MRRFRDDQPIWHAVFWIVLYVLAVNVGDALSALMGVPNAVTAPLLALMTVGLLFYLRGAGLFRYYGLTLPKRADLRRVWFYLPLALIALLPVVFGNPAGLSTTGVLLFVLLMLGVGFLEELIFRGFLYQAIRESSGLTRAIVISGITFGIGHVVNLLRGYTGGEQLVQILIGIALGLVLAMLVAITGSILPGALFHTVLNTGASLTERSLAVDAAVLGVSLVVCAVYGAYLWLSLRDRERPAPMLGRRTTEGF